MGMNEIEGPSERAQSGVSNRSTRLKGSSKDREDGLLEECPAADCVQRDSGRWHCSVGVQSLEPGAHWTVS